MLPLNAATFDTAFEPRHGEAVQVAALISRVTAPNSGPYTFQGTNTYIIGQKTLCVVDPGPDDEVHLDALMRAIAKRPVSYIFITHTHLDHSALAPKLQALTDAKTVGYGPHVFTRSLTSDEKGIADAACDLMFKPDLPLMHEDMIGCDEWVLRGVHTPGHTANHMAYALEGTDILFSGDHVMAWATTMIAPPDGSMHDYLGSLDVLLNRPDRIYFPGHGGPVVKPNAFVRALKAHRLMREASVLDRLRAGDETILTVVQNLYKDTHPRLHGAAAMTVFAHLERLIALGAVRTSGTLSLDSHFQAIG